MEHHVEPRLQHPSLAALLLGVVMTLGATTALAAPAAQLPASTAAPAALPDDVTVRIENLDTAPPLGYYSRAMLKVPLSGDAERVDLRKQASMRSDYSFAISLDGEAAVPDDAPMRITVFDRGGAPVASARVRDGDTVTFQSQGLRFTVRL